VKLSKAVELICDLELLDNDATRRERYDKARFLVRSGVINPDKPVSRGQTAQFRLDTVCALRMCFALYDLGVEVGTVAEIARAFHHPMAPARPEEPHQDMCAAIDAIRSETAVAFKIQVGRLMGQLSPYRIGQFYAEGQTVRAAQRSPILDEIDTSYGVISLDLSVLLLPIIRVFDDMQAPEK
jgi:hypothetical protein